MVRLRVSPTVIGQYQHNGDCRLTMQGATHQPRGCLESRSAVTHIYSGLIVCPGGIMKYRVAIYDLEYEIEAKSTEGAIRAAIARYAKMETAQTNRHCSPDRLTRASTVGEDREWEVLLE